MELPHKHIVLFDGVCNLCNNSVNFIIKHDSKNKFVFTAIQSETGKFIIKNNNIDTNKVDSIILCDLNKKLSYKSTAALIIASKLGFPINLLGVLLVIPPFIRNWVYNYIAKNRYQWYGKKDSCMIPTSELKSRFLN